MGPWPGCDLSSVLRAAALSAIYFLIFSKRSPAAVLALHGSRGYRNAAFVMTHSFIFYHRGRFKEATVTVGYFYVQLARRPVGQDKGLCPEGLARPVGISQPAEPGVREGLARVASGPCPDAFPLGRLVRPMSEGTRKLAPRLDAKGCWVLGAGPGPELGSSLLATPHIQFKLLTVEGHGEPKSRYSRGHGRSL